MNHPTPVQHEHDVAAEADLDPLPEVSPASSSSSGLSGTDPHALEKIRNLLFGEQTRAHDQRLGTLEARLGREVKEIREAVEARFEAWEQKAAEEAEEVRRLLRDQYERLAQRLSAEQDERRQALAEEQRQREAALETLEADVQEAVAHLRQQGNALQARLQTQIAAVEDALTAAVDRAKAHEDRVAARFAEIETSTQEAFSTVGEEKTSRTDLADLFGELSGRLRHTARTPQGEGRLSEGEPSA